MSGTCVKGALMKINRIYGIFIFICFCFIFLYVFYQQRFDRQYQNSKQVNYQMLSQLDKQFLKRQLKILQSDPAKWNKDQYSRLLALLKFPDPIQKQFLEIGIEHNNLRNFNTILEKLEEHNTDFNYFPFQKLRCAIGLLVNPSDQDSNQNSILAKNYSQSSRQINVSQEVVILLVQAIDKLQDILIIELTASQVAGILKNSKLQGHANLIKKYNIDGFNLICSLSELDTLKEIRNYFKDEDIKRIVEVSHLFLIQYFRQTMLDKLRKKTPIMNKINTQSDQSSLFIKKKSSKQFFIQSSNLSKKNSQDQIDTDPVQENGFAESVLGQSQMGNSVMGQSQMGTSQLATSEMGTSEIGQFQRGSVYAQSQYAASVRGSVICRMSFRVGDNNQRASLMYNSQILNELRQVCLNLPFDLLNLQPLQQIKIRALKNAFNKQLDKGTWIFSVQGAKLGRDKQNNLRFPDELSISSKHAQILFKFENFYLQDLGSKTGTYLRIEKNYQILDQTCIQFTTDIEILFRILKKGPNQGVIKAEIKKPQNLPDYKISLKEGFKIKIGRSQRCHIRVNNPSLGQKHSQIFYKDCCFYFKNCNGNISWLRLSPKSVCSETFKLNQGDIFRLSSKKSFYVEGIYNQLQKKLS